MRICMMGDNSLLLCSILNHIHVGAQINEKPSKLILMMGENSCCCVVS